jgi:hypothetical protein
MLAKCGTLQGRCGSGQAAPIEGDRLHLGGVGDVAGVPLLGVSESHWQLAQVLLCFCADSDVGAARESSHRNI